MVKINVHVAKAQLSKYLEMVASGETVIICKRDVPVAELRPVTANEPRPLGTGTKRYPGWNADLSAVMEPLEEEDLEEFEQNLLR